MPFPPSTSHRAKRKLAPGDRVVRDAFGTRGTLVGTVTRVTPIRLPRGQKSSSGGTLARVRVRWDNGAEAMMEDRVLDWADDFNPEGRNAMYAYGKIERVTQAPPTPVLTKGGAGRSSTPQPVPMRREQKGKKLQPYVRESLQHGEILASSRGGSSYYAPGRACVTKSGPPRRDQVDLVFVPRNVPAGKHSKRPPPPGPALRFCIHGEGFGPMVPVKDPHEAKEIAAAYQKCLRADPKKAQAACVVEATGQPIEALSFGDMKRRRKSRR